MLSAFSYNILLDPFCRKFASMAVEIFCFDPVVVGFRLGEDRTTDKSDRQKRFRG